jgi:hypothetical protein
VYQGAQRRLRNLGSLFNRILRLNANETAGGREEEQIGPAIPEISSQKKCFAALAQNVEALIVPADAGERLLNQPMQIARGMLGGCCPRSMDGFSHSPS